MSEMEYTNYVTSSLWPTAFFWQVSGLFHPNIKGSLETKLFSNCCMLYIMDNEYSYVYQPES